MRGVGDPCSTHAHTHAHTSNQPRQKQPPFLFLHTRFRRSPRTNLWIDSEVNAVDDEVAGKVLTYELKVSREELVRVCLLLNVGKLLCFCAVFLEPLAHGLNLDLHAHEEMSARAAARRH